LQNNDLNLEKKQKSERLDTDKSFQSEGDSSDEEKVIKKPIVKQIKVKFVENSQNLFKSDIFSKLGKKTKDENFINNFKVNKNSKLNQILRKRAPESR